MSSMSDSTTKPGPVKRPVPVRLTRRDDAAIRAMQTRALPDDKPKLDVAAFNSSI
ncbi:MAG TPA: hypothetical protein VF760_04160 [Xanthobacteraceae bacterium]